MRKKYNNKILTLFVAILLIVSFLSAISPSSIEASTGDVSVITAHNYSPYTLSTATSVNEIPDAATSNYNYLATGIIILILALAFFLASKKR
jgi:LPXTG-motif cell wall-anchored protein